MKNILLIEDNNQMRENTAEILQLANYNVMTAKNGKIGVELAQKENPDLIICDIMMPLLDGYGVLHLLSKSDSTASIPFIFLTAKTERVDYRKGMEMGADDYLTKPFDDIELLNSVESRLRKNEVLKKEFSKDIKGLNEFIDDVRGMDELIKLSNERDVRIYKKKEIIFSEGSYPKGLYFISKGKVKIYKSNEDGKGFVTGLHKDGDYIGYLPLLEESKYMESAVAMEESEICIISKEDFFSLIFRNTDVSKKFVQILSNRIMEKEEQLVKLAYNSVRKRVAEGLIMLFNKYKENDRVFSMSVPREDLANIVGTATETVIRTLSDFKDEGLIAIDGGKITIQNPERLIRLKN